MPLEYKPITVDFPRPDISKEMNARPGPVRTGKVVQEVPKLANAKGAEQLSSAGRAWVNDVIRKANSNGLLQNLRDGVQKLGQRTSASGKALNPAARTMVRRAGTSALGGAASQALGPLGSGLTGYEIGSALYDHYAPNIQDMLDEVAGRDWGNPEAPTQVQTKWGTDLFAPPAQLQPGQIPAAPQDFSRANPHELFNMIEQELLAQGHDPSVTPRLATQILIDSRMGKTNPEAGVANTPKLPAVKDLFG